MTSPDRAARRTPANPQQDAGLDESAATRALREAAAPASPDGGRITRGVAGRRGAGPTVARQASALQRRLGNQHVIGMLHGPEGWTAQAEESSDASQRTQSGPPRAASDGTIGGIGATGDTIQRYAVGAPASAQTEPLYNWLQANSPHRPAWALTSTTFTWSRSLSAVPGEGEGSYVVTVANSTVGKNTTVDMPNWTADNAPMQTAWDAMWSELRAHEGEHEAIATTWQTTLQEHLAGAEYVLTASSADAAKAQALATLDGEWTAWIAQHQADQSAIDPFFATLNYPAEGGEESEGPELPSEAPADTPSEAPPAP